MAKRVLGDDGVQTANRRSARSSARPREHKLSDTGLSARQRLNPTGARVTQGNRAIDSVGKSIACLLDWLRATADIADVRAESSRGCKTLCVGGERRGRKSGGD